MLGGYIAIEAVFLIATAVVKRSHTLNEFLVAFFTVTGAIGLQSLSLLEHSRSVRPSTLSTRYTLAITVLDFVWLTMPDQSIDEALWPLLLARILYRLAVICFECQNKRAILLEEYRDLPVETTTSFIGRTLFWWINGLLAKGYNNTLVNENLPAIDNGLQSEDLRAKVLQAWNDAGMEKHHRCIFPF